MVTRTVTWGEGLVVEIFKTPGGLKPVVDALIGELGPQIGVRNTFSKLFKVEDPAALDPKDRWRAWLLLTAIGHDPSDWGIDESAVPPAIDVRYLKSRLERVVRRQGLEPRTRWLRASCSAN